MQIKGRDYQVLYTKESKEVQVAIDLLSMVEHKSLTVEYKERKAFLTPFIPLLINPQKEHGLKGVSPFAKLLHLLVNFMDADGSGNTLNPDCIEDEIWKTSGKAHLTLTGSKMHSRLSANNALK